MQFFDTLFAWTRTNAFMLLQLVLVVAAFFVMIGGFAGFLANRYADRPRLAAFLSIVAAFSGDVVKFLDAIALFIGRIPPRFGRRKVIVIKPTVVDDEPSGPHSFRGALMPVLGVVFAPALAICMAISIAACALVAPTANEVSCLSGRIASNPNETPAQYMGECGIQTLSLLEQGLALLAQSFAATPNVTDGGAPLVGGPIDVRAIMLARVQHVQALAAGDGGAQ